MDIIVGYWGTGPVTMPAAAAPKRKKPQQQQVDPNFARQRGLVRAARTWCPWQGWPLTACVCAAQPFGAVAARQAGARQHE